MSTPKDTALSACRQLMEPIIGILLRNGVTHKELAAVCKQLYVQVASQEFGIRGRDTNLSRIAMLTGIDRKEVARIKEAWKNNDESEAYQQGQDRMTRLISGWYQDPDFLSSDGIPKVITFDGNPIGFTELVRRYGGDLPASAILKELKRSGVVIEDDQGNLHVVKRYYVPSQSDPGALLRAGSVISDLGNTLYHNLYKANPEKHKPLHFERRASNIQMSPEDAEAFRAFVAAEGQEFLEIIDAWLSEHERAPTDESTETLRLGVGAYLIESTPPEQKT